MAVADLRRPLDRVMKDDIRRWISLIETMEHVLYHGTSLACALDILHSNVIEGATERPWLPAAVSASRSWRIAHEFGTYWERMYPTVLVLDRWKLRQRYRVEPHADKDDSGSDWHQGGRGAGNSEAEERIIGRVSPANRYLVSVTVNPQFLTDAAKNAEWLDAMVEDGCFASTDDVIKALSALGSSPLLNAVRPSGIDALDAAFLKGDGRQS